MDKNRLQRRLAQKSEIFGELPRSRRRETANRNSDKMNAERFHFLALAFAKLRRFTTKIDDRGGAELLKFVKTFNVRLRGAKKRIGNLTTGVGNESEEKNKTKSKAKERIANWLETV
jgi:hypothetical protein